MGIKLDVSEGMEPAPCGSPSKDDPARYCIREVGHSGRHQYRPINGVVNQASLGPEDGSDLPAPRLISQRSCLALSQ